jgi:hypothetical protein
MNKVLFACLAALFIAGCTSTRSPQNSLNTLRKELQHRLGTRCDYGSIEKDSDLGHYFTVKPRPGWEIVVKEREFMTEEEWGRQRAQLDALLEKLPKISEDEAIKQIVEADKLFRLPKWSYDHICVEVSFEYPDVASSPENQKADVETRLVENEITSLLTPYRKTTQSQ